MVSSLRSNAQWIASLRSDGADAANAQQELRELVLSGLARGLRGRPELHASLEDFTHDAVLRILASLESFRGDSQFSTWALAIAMRSAFSDLRRKRWRERAVDEPELAASRTETQPTAAVTPERQLAQREILSALERITHRLTERQRSVVFAELREMPQAEIAVQMGIDRNAVYKLGHDARRALQRGLEAAGFDRDAVRAAFEES